MNNICIKVFAILKLKTPLILIKLILLPLQVIASRSLIMMVLLCVTQDSVTAAILIWFYFDVCCWCSTSYPSSWKWSSVQFYRWETFIIIFIIPILRCTLFFTSLIGKKINCSMLIVVNLIVPPKQTHTWNGNHTIKMLTLKMELVLFSQCYTGFTLSQRGYLHTVYHALPYIITFPQNSSLSCFFSRHLFV